MKYLPLIVLLLLCGFFALSLAGEKHQAASPSPLVGKQMPPVVTLPAGKLAMVNVFASWCAPCALEHPQLMELSKRLPIHGIAWKNKKADVEKWLGAHGNPYRDLRIDEKGETTIPLALTGVPESFIVDENGIVIYHTRAPLTPDLIASDIEPLLKERGL